MFKAIVRTLNSLTIVLEVTPAEGIRASQDLKLGEEVCLSVTEAPLPPPEPIKEAPLPSTAVTTENPWT